MGTTSTLMAIVAGAVLSSPALANPPADWEIEQFIPGLTTQQALVYADVVSVAEVGQFAWRLKLDVKCTLAGPYDAGRHPSVEVKMGQGTLGMPFRRPPEANAHVVVVLSCGMAGDPYEWRIEPGYFAFMPTDSAVAEVNGFDDPVVARIAGRVRELVATRQANWHAACQALVVEIANTGVEWPPKAISDFLREGEEALEPNPEETPRAP